MLSDYDFLLTLSMNMAWSQNLNFHSSFFMLLTRFAIFKYCSCGFLYKREGTMLDTPQRKFLAQFRMDSWTLRNIWDKGAQEQLKSKFDRFENDMECQFLKDRGLFIKSGSQIWTHCQKAKFQVQFSCFWLWVKHAFLKRSHHLF